MPWFAGFGDVQCRTTNQRIWNKKSAGSKPGHSLQFTFQGIFTACSHCTGHCFSYCVVDYEQMVAGLSIQDKYHLEHICDCRVIGINYCVVDSKFPGREIGDSETGEIVADGMIS